MEKKDLAEGYALEEYARVNGENDPIFTDNRCFTFDDIKYAFNAGRESVVENMPELEWNLVVNVWNLATDAAISQVNKKMSVLKSEQEITDYIKKALKL